MVYSSRGSLQYGTDTIEVVHSSIHRIEIENEEPSSNKHSFGLSWIIQFNGTKSCEKLSNVTFLLLLIGLLICMVVIMAMCARPKSFGMEVDDRYLRIINDEAIESDVSFFEKSFFSAK